LNDARQPQPAALINGRREPFLSVVAQDSLRFDIVDHVMLIVHADMAPADADWARMCVVRNANGRKLRGTLVVAPPRASINAAQRADVATFMRETGCSVAVLTDSALIRGVARAVGFLGVNVRAFEPSEIAPALSYLLLPASKHAEVIRRVEGIKAQLASVTRAGDAGATR
jgi:hypothetical protein